VEFLAYAGVLRKCLLDLSPTPSAGVAINVLEMKPEFGQQKNQSIKKTTPATMSGK